MMAVTDTLLDQFLSKYDFSRRYERTINAPLERVWNALLTTDISSITLIRFLSFVQRNKSVKHNSDLMGVLRPHGFLELAARNYQEIVVGAIAKPWHSDGGVLQRLDGEAFTEFDEPGYVRIAANVMLTPVDRERTRVSTETRVQALDAMAMRKFAPYWAMVKHPSTWVRRAILKNLEQRAMQAQSEAKTQKAA
ncbi:MAG TPA: hypothetical protein VGC88_01880 [Terriglobales bacterium]|jgi:hypothetical protein